MLIVASSYSVTCLVDTRNGDLDPYHSTICLAMPDSCTSASSVSLPVAIADVACRKDCCGCCFNYCCASRQSIDVSSTTWQ